MKSTLALEADGLVKVFGETRAVDGLDLAVSSGRVYGVLGPNGAGKTTALRMFATLLRPDDGRVRVFGHDVVADAESVRKLVSLTGQFASIDEDLTGRQNLILLSRLLGYSRMASREKVDSLLEAFDLAAAADRKAATYSGGMRRRLDIAASVVSTPGLIFLDEPTTGLDPRSRNQVWDLVRAVVARGVTVILTTQYLDEADQLADRIAVIDHGKVVAEGTPSELKASVGSGALHVRVRDPQRRAETESILSATLDASVRIGSDPATLSVAVSDTRRVARALGELSEGGIDVVSYALGQPSLDEVFLALTGHPAEDDTITTSKEDVA
ncbi:daunorubicin resistance protein DrrA family ABC transporter ATP-binding protein [Nocardia sp. CNY236]|uniref:daunorubicin resistance protein DrrA family ABC transporter ATP-binding protein n=1 Tax=Nocardia sp. CNY236 TaxID=1169152 RepID=UPI00042400B7|nr:daunorubicin resistance protein DrrA family ABC transporter ATP-binding protein [Nocardia sp. CNY236]